MGTFYVATTGNDSTGDGSSGNPWLTIGYTLGQCPLDEANVINVDAGTYPEQVGASPYLHLTFQFTVSCLIKPWHTGDAVIITDNSSGNYCIRVQGATNIEFRDLTIQMAAENTIATVFFSDANASGIVFTRCTIKALHAVSNKQIFRCSTITASAITGIVLDGCTLEEQASGGNTLIGVSVKVGDGGTVDITLNDCTVTGYGSVITAEFLYTHANATLTVTCDGGTYTSTGTYAFQVNGGTVAISNATFTNTGTPALVLGRDNVALYTVTGSVTNCVISSSTSHAFLCGGGTNSVAISGCVMNGGDYALVIKESVDAAVSTCAILQGTSGSVYFKAAVGASVDRCRIVNTVGGPAIKLSDGDTSNQSGTCDVTRSKVTVAGSSALFDWAGVAEDSGGGVCNWNKYEVKGAATWGTAYGTSISSLATLRAAWSTYDVPTNDNASKLLRAFPAIRRL